jgi:hypothetical protein
MSHLTSWKPRIIKAILFLWGLQLIWLGAYFGPEVKDLAQRLARGDVGAAVRREDPLYPWLQSLAGLIPGNATYVFLDNYEAGKEIEAHYFLIPRRHILLTPDVPADFLFYTLHQEKASFLLIRDRSLPLGSGVEAAQGSPAFRALDLPGPGLGFRVDYDSLKWGFYD